MPVRKTFGFVPPGTEIYLYVVLFPFAIVFAVGLYRRYVASGLVQLIMQSPGGLSGAIKRFTWYALLQWRVARRARGWPHLAIFYGFLTLLFGTTVVALDWDIARPLGFRLLVGSPYLYLETLLDLLGLVFVLGLLAALVSRVNRLLVADRDQRKVQWQFLGLIVGLLFMGSTGFVLEGLRLTIDPVAWAGWSFVGARVADLIAGFGLRGHAPSIYVGLWWSHAVVAFTLIAMLPYTAFVHSVAAPLNLMVYPGRPRLALGTPFDLRELLKTGNFDVKVGASTLADLERNQRLALFACTNCGRCEDVCPAFAMGTDLSPRRLVQALRWRALARDMKTDLIDAGTVTASELWACTTCAACVEACPVFIAPMDYIVPFRRELVTRQRVEKQQADFLANLGRSFNPYGMPASRRTQLASALSEPAETSGPE